LFLSEISGGCLSVSDCSHTRALPGKAEKLRKEAAPIENERQTLKRWTEHFVRVDRTKKHETREVEFNDCLGALRMIWLPSVTDSSSYNATVRNSVSRMKLLLPRDVSEPPT
jgi:hypothetical protein